MPTPPVTNIRQALDSIPEVEKHLLLGRVNHCDVKAARLLGGVDPHHHETEDEAFLVVDGRLRVEFDDHEQIVEAGEIIIIPAGVTHNPTADVECRVLIFEPSDITKTGHQGTSSAARKPQIINLQKAMNSFSDHWKPHVLGEVSGCALKLAKLQGDFHFHSHELEDELFLILEGALVMHFEDGDTPLTKEDLQIIPMGVSHNPESEAECTVLLFEPVATLNTGDASHERTIKPEDLPTIPAT